MPKSKKTYTYRGGEKIELEKSSKQIVARALPDQLTDLASTNMQQVSSASTRITTTESELESVMSKSRDIAPTHHAYFEAKSGSEFLITDRILVTFKDNLSDKLMDEFTNRYGLVKKNRYSDKDYLFQLTNKTGINPLKLVVKLMEEEPLVELVEHDLNQRMKLYHVQTPVDTNYIQQWHLHTNFNDQDFDSRSSSKCEDAWNLLGNYGSQEVVIAISDDGCKMNHIDFDSANKFAGWGYMRGGDLITSIDSGANKDEMYKQGANHGTACCGVASAEIDARLTVGAAPGCRLLPIQWESSGPYLLITDSKMLSILNYIADKADVMSNSWGSVPTNLWAVQVVSRIKDLAQTGGRRGKGIFFLWAAGNENCLINYHANQEVPHNQGWNQYGDWEGVKATSIFRNNLVGINGLMHIAALASTAKRSHYSNYGPGISLCAPTSNSHTYNRMSVKGLGITTTIGSEIFDITSSFGGTSSATPLVAGIAALIISANPNLSAIEVIEILKKSASKDLNFEGYPQTSPIYYDSDTSWDVSPIAPFDTGNFKDIGSDDGSWSPWFGHGRVDANAAVAEALRLRDEKVIYVEDTPYIIIPDNISKAIERTLMISENKKLQNIEVEINITHTYIGDLIVELISPDNTIILLHNQKGDYADNIIKTYTMINTPNLMKLQTTNINGAWKLKVSDKVSVDDGKLNRWALKIVYL